MFCKNCGCKIDEGSKFCCSCGEKIISEKSNEKVYDGEIRKCPNCGNPLGAFDLTCSSCGYELRERTISSSLLNFQNEIKKIQNEQNTNNSIGWGKLFKKKEKQENEHKLMNLIQLYPIPNTKEDILEFLIMAEANIDTSKFNNFDSHRDKGLSVDVTKVWLSKYEQAYQKAKLTLPQEQMVNFDIRHNNLIKEIKKTKRNNIFFGIGCWVFLLIFMWATTFMSTFMSTYNNPQKEKINDDLNKIVSEIEIDIKNRDYTAALIKANNLTFDRSLDYGLSKQWDEKREEIINIINEAKQNE